MEGTLAGIRAANVYDMGSAYLAGRAAAETTAATYNTRTAATINNAFRDGKAINYRNDPFEVIRPTNPNLDNALIRAKGNTPRVQGMLNTAKTAISREQRIKQLMDDWEMTRSQAQSFLRSQAKRFPNG